MPQTIIVGHITTIFPAELRGNFELRRFHVKEPGTVRYPQTYELQAWQGDCNLLDKFSYGDLVEVNVEIKGREWIKDGRAGVINTLRAIKITLKDPMGPLGGQK